jgi:hypothetical protein
VKNITIKFLLLGLLILGIIYIPSISSALSEIEIQEGEISIETIPNNPQPYQDVTINLSSYATDLNKAMLIWETASGIVLSGIGEKSYSFKALGPNTTSIIDVSITPVGSINTINKRIIVTPSEIEMMWESVNGYTPPFYKGKSLPISGSFIRVVAIPNTNTIKSGIGSMTYTWKNGDNTVLEASGYNKNSYEFKNSMFDTKNEIKVTASSINGDYGAENTINIPLYDPRIIFYKKSPTEGIFYNNALNKESTMTEDEMTIVAEPYFLPIKTNGEYFTYNWTINDKIISTPTKKTELTIRPNSRGGYVVVNLSIENAMELFQNINNKLTINL